MNDFCLQYILLLLLRSVLELYFVKLAQLLRTLRAMKRFRLQHVVFSHYVVLHNFAFVECFIQFRKYINNL